MEWVLFIASLLALAGTYLRMRRRVNLSITIFPATTPPVSRETPAEPVTPETPEHYSFGEPVSTEKAPRMPKVRRPRPREAAPDHYE
jgi:hypothetical protein